MSMDRSDSRYLQLSYFKGTGVAMTFKGFIPMKTPVEERFISVIFSVTRTSWPLRNPWPNSQKATYNRETIKKQS